ncbi:hypothetical protein CEXT_599891, partial [Caerostris extrusa]
LSVEVNSSRTGLTLGVKGEAMVLKLPGEKGHILTGYRTRLMSIGNHVTV